MTPSNWPIHRSTRYQAMLFAIYGLQTIDELVPNSESDRSDMFGR